MLSSIASSMLMSMIDAPSSICLAAICSASSYFPSEIRRANLREPATLVLSPTFVKLLCLTSTVTASRPLTFNALSVIMPYFPDKPSFFAWLSVNTSVFPDNCRGAMPSSALAMALIWSGVVPQHPPTMFTRPREAISLT